MEKGYVVVGLLLDGRSCVINDGGHPKSGRHWRYILVRTTAVCCVNQGKGRDGQPNQ